MKLFLPDGQEVKIPADGLTVEEARKALVGLGYTSVETAQGTVLGDGNIRFSRPTGGEKGVVA